MATLKQVLKPKRKIKKCPHCKSNKGFELRYSIFGSGMILMDFKGNTLDAEREVFDKLDKYAECINCKKTIDADLLKVE